MASCLGISIHFLQPFSHGRGDSAEPQWPPSPLRLVQALVAASAGRWNERTSLTRAAPALRWLETLSPPDIIAPPATLTNHPYRLYVPDNVADKVAASWSRGGDASIADYRTEKDVRAANLEGDTVHYLYPLGKLVDGVLPHIETIALAARAIIHLGWGIDMVVGNASVISPEQAAELPGWRWRPSSNGGTPLRVPKAGTLDNLMRKHSDFLGRITDNGFCPVPPLRVFDVLGYRSQDEPLGRPYRVFELRAADGSRFRYPHRRFIHIAGMVRHLAIDAMSTARPRGVNDDWVDTYVAGHQQQKDDKKHRQLSYLPLPSVGHQHTDPGVRRVMIAAPVGDDRLLDQVARSISGAALRPERGEEFAGREPPILVPVQRDSVADFYTRPANLWHSFTPVILPGHDDHKPDKTRKLVKKALIQSGIDQPCDFQWDAFSRFPQAYSAHKYDKNRRPQGYVRPKHLLSQTTVHLTLQFRASCPGPIVVGAGRHCGFGLKVGSNNGD